MIKADSFLKYLCGVLEFRFVSGFNSLGFRALYDNFDSSILHYIPAVSVNSALGMVTGVSIGGVKGVLLLAENQLEGVKCSIKDVNLYNNVPIMVIVLCGSNYKTKDKLFKYFRVKDDFILTLKKAEAYIKKERRPVVLLLNEEDLV